MPEPTLAIDYNRHLYARADPLNLVDPTGHCATEVRGPTLTKCSGGGRVVILVATFVGGTANAGGNIAAQVYENWDDQATISENLAKVNMTEASTAWISGAGAGAISVLMGTVGNLMGSSLLGAGQEVATDMIVDDMTLLEAIDIETAIAAGIGAGAAMFQGTFPKKLTYKLNDGNSLDIATGHEALAFGGSWFAASTQRELLIIQMRYLSGLRFVSGIMIGNFPVETQGSE